MNCSGNFTDGHRVAVAGPSLRSTDPATGEEVWAGRIATLEDVDRAVSAARTAFRGWETLDISDRAAYLTQFADVLKNKKEDLAHVVSCEVGKPRWEARTEVAAAIAKVELTLQAQASRRSSQELELPGGRGRVCYHPHGVIAVLGPFNFPAHLPGGHLVPALLAGNTVVFKPSELTPGVGEWLVRAWQQAGLPPGVLNLVQGRGETGRALVEHPGIDGVFFTGSYTTGRAIHRSLAGRPEVILALEMGGNNPLVWWDAEDLGAAAQVVLQSAFATAGQRCTCARRLILPVGPEGDDRLHALLEAVRRMRVGLPTDEPEPFMGPVVSAAAAKRLLRVQQRLVERGAHSLLPMTVSLQCPALLTPGVLDVTPLQHREDEEWFGPLLQVIRVAEFDAAVREANHTAYGLSAGLLSDDRDRFRVFAAEVRAGVVVWNRPTTGASGRLPFGGLGRSGNHRASGYHTVDYCSDPVVVLEAEMLASPPMLPADTVPLNQ